MMTLVTGGSASGKSFYAEELLASVTARRKIYLATMVPWDSESLERIEKHRRMRSARGFETMEVFTGLSGFSPGSREAVSDRAVLLECMSNLVANERYMKGGTNEAIEKRIINGVRHLQKQAGDIIIVTNEVFSDGLEYDAETRSYLNLLGTANIVLAALADTVIEVVYGIPVPVKLPERKG